MVFVVNYMILIKIPPAVPFLQKTIKPWFVEFLEYYNTTLLQLYKDFIETDTSYLNIPKRDFLVMSNNFPLMTTDRIVFPKDINSMRKID